MRAAQIVTHREPFVVGEVADPKIDSAGAIVQVEANGMCRSDWHTWNGDWAWFGGLPELPVVPGHEFSGTVVEIGSDVRRLRVGDRVTVPFTEACGHCDSCVRGRSATCRSVMFPGYSHSGGYGALVGMTNADLNCIPLPEEIEAVSAAGLSCRYSTAFNAVVHMGRMQPGEWVVVVGAGGMGVSAVQIAAALGGRVIAVDIRDEALEFARLHGAEHAFNSTKVDDVPAAIKELTGGGAHLSIDCCTREGSTVQSLLGLRGRGRHVQAGLTSKVDSGMMTIPVDLINLLELEFLGCSATSHSRYPELLGLVAAGRLRPADLVTKRISLDEVTDSMRALDTFDTIGCHVITSF
jgi:D-arabinose 1-dehydrogenase-like Zn-dependent alcohol dehydrogenase